MARRMRGRGIRRSLQIREFACPICGSTSTAPKQHRKTGTGHVKTMWCWGCQAVRDMVQVKDLGLYSVMGTAGVTAVSEGEGTRNPSVAPDCGEKDETEGGEPGSNSEGNVSAE